MSDNAYRISLAGINAKTVPLAYVQIKSDWLVKNGVLGACAELDVIIEQFKRYELDPILANVSRADLFVDFVCDSFIFKIHIFLLISYIFGIGHYETQTFFYGTFE